ncbi:MAG: ABC transporter substrate-binding protein [Leptolyngbyaceae cyanobacterium bins.349]|nr:ABC transporter substrate-binding protein [Leptolyngbyaceae cyanobacterium bins.349]
MGPEIRSRVTSLGTRSLRFLILFGVGLLLMVSCSRSTPDQGSSRDGRIVVGTTAVISTLDPADANTIFANNLLYNLGDRLYTYASSNDPSGSNSSSSDPSGSNSSGSNPGRITLEPQLATALPTISPDGLTYTIPLRQGVVFHDGTPFNAAAMVFSLQRFIQNAGTPSYLLADVDTVTATGDYELTIRLKQPFAAFTALLAFSGLCAVSPQAYEIQAGSFKASEFVGTGPYQLGFYGTDQIRLETFEQYWGTKPANQGIDIQFFSSPANLYNAFRTGAVDVAFQNLAIDQIRNLQERAATEGWQVLASSGSGIDYLTLNLNSPPLNQLAVRQAIAAVMDRPLLQDRVFMGQIEPLYSLIPSTLAEQKPVFEQTFGDRNTAKAKTLLTQAGYSEANPLKLEFWYRSNLVNDQLAAITLQAIAQRQLGNLLQFELKGIESTTAYQNLDKGAYPIFLLDWSPDFLDADNYIQPFMECSKGSPENGCEDGSSFLQGSFYYSDRANQLITRSRQTQNPVERQQVFADLQTLLVEDVPFIPLWQSKDFLFAQPNIQGAMLQVTQKVPFWPLKKS